MVSLFHANRFPAGREVMPRDQPVPSDALVSEVDGPSSNVNDSEADGVPMSSNDPNPPPTQTDYFVPLSALNHPQPSPTQLPGTDVTPAPSSTIVSTPDLPASSSITLSTSTLQPTPTAVSIQSGALSTGSSNKKYIIGGAVGGGVLVLILLALLLFCCCKRRGKRDLEHSGGGHSEGQHGYGQFACCNHGNCNKNGGQPQMEQKTPMKPFILKSDPVVLISKGPPQQHSVSLNRRDSTESQDSAGSDYSTETLCSSDSEGPQRGKRRSQKRPPPLKLTALVTPVVNGPQDNPRRRADRSSPPSPHEIPMVAVDPPQSGTPDRMRRH